MPSGAASVSAPRRFTRAVNARWVIGFASIVIARMTMDGCVTLSTGESHMGLRACDDAGAMLCQRAGDPVVPRHGAADRHRYLAARSRWLHCTCVTILAGNAAIKAGRQMARKLFYCLRRKCLAPGSRITVRKRRRSTPSFSSPNRKLTFGELARMHVYRRGGEELAVTATLRPTNDLVMARPRTNTVTSRRAIHLPRRRSRSKSILETGQVEILETWLRFRRLRQSAQPDGRATG